MASAGSDYWIACLLCSVIVFLEGLGYSLLIPIAPTLAKEVYHVSQMQMGTLISLFALGTVFSSPAYPVTVQTLGAKKSLILGMFLQCAGLLLGQYTFWLACIGRLMQGVGSITFVGCVHWVRSTTKDEILHNTGQTILTVCLMTGLTMGNTISGLCAAYLSLTSSYFIMAMILLTIIAFSSVYMVWTSRKEAELAESLLHDDSGVDYQELPTDERPTDNADKVASGDEGEKQKSKSVWYTLYQVLCLTDVRFWLFLRVLGAVFHGVIPSIAFFLSNILHKNTATVGWLLFCEAMVYAVGALCSGLIASHVVRYTFPILMIAWVCTPPACFFLGASTTTTAAALSLTLMGFSAGGIESVTLNELTRCSQRQLGEDTVSTVISFKMSLIFIADFLSINLFSFLATRFGFSDMIAGLGWAVIGLTVVITVWYYGLVWPILKKQLAEDAMIKQKVVQ